MEYNLQISTKYWELLGCWIVLEEVWFCWINTVTWYWGQVGLIYTDSLTTSNYNNQGSLFKYIYFSIWLIDWLMSSDLNGLHLTLI